MSVKELKREMGQWGVSTAGCLEKGDLVERMLEHVAAAAARDAQVQREREERERLETFSDFLGIVPNGAAARFLGHIVSYYPVLWGLQEDLERFEEASQGREFCMALTWDPAFIDACCCRGCFPMATLLQRMPVMLVKLHHRRCVLHPLGDLHIGRTVRKRARNFLFTVNRRWGDTVQAVQDEHGHNWLCPPLEASFRAMHRETRRRLRRRHQWLAAHGAMEVAAAMGEEGKAPAAAAEGEEGAPRDPFLAGAAAAAGGEAAAEELERTEGLGARGRFRAMLYSFEVWDRESGELAAGDLGYAVGSMYTSLTGFHRPEHKSSGSVLLSAIGCLLRAAGMQAWDFGMSMKYKLELGAGRVSRKDFLALQAACASSPDCPLSLDRLPVPCPIPCPDGSPSVDCRALIEKIASS